MVSFAVNMVRGSFGANVRLKLVLTRVHLRAKFRVPKQGGVNLPLMGCVGTSGPTTANLTNR